MIKNSLLNRMASLMNPKWNGQFSCFDLVAKTNERSRTVVRVRDIEIGGNDFVVMAGPCAVESESQLLETAEAVAEAGARDSARRSLQASIFAIRVSRPRRGRSQDSAQGPRRDRAGHRY